MKGAWVKEVKEPHVCVMPGRGGRWSGSQWRCGECEALWELKVPDETYAGRGNDIWVRIGDSNGGPISSEARV